MKRLNGLKLISLMLVLAMLIELLPANAFATPKGEDDYHPPAQAEAVPDEPAEAGVTDVMTEVETPDPAVLGEITELREENIKHFRMEDGTYTAVTYDQPVHYKNSDGIWQNIDNTLTYHAAAGTEKASYRTGPGSFGASFDETLTEDGRIFETDDGAISLFLDMEANSDTTTSDSEEPAEPDDPGQEDVPDQEDVSDEEDTPVSNEAPMEQEAPVEDDSAEPEDTLDESLPAEENDLPESAESNEEQFPDPEEHPAAPREVPLQPSSSIRAEVETVSATIDVTDKYSAFVSGAQRSALVYRDILPEIDLRYEINTLSIKESIIVNMSCEEYEYGFRLLLDGLTPTMDDAGAISLKDSDGTEQYYIPAPYMIDSNHLFSLAASYTLEPLDDDVWLLGLTVDADWMNDSDRAFPVIIDPTIVKSCSTYSGDISSTYVVERQPTTTHSGSQLYCGKTDSSSGGWQDVYLHVNVLPDIPPNCSVVSAAVGFWQNGYSADNSSSSTYIAAYELTNEGSKTSSQTYMNWIHGLTWNTRPSDSGIVLDYAKLSASTSSNYQFWDVTAAAVKWYEDAATNHGILLKRWESDGSNKRVLLMGYGTYTPSYFAVAYRNNVGIEDRYSYQTQAVDRAGVAYMGDYSGNLTVVTPLVSFDSVINGYTLNLVYNSANAIYSFTHNENAGIHAQGYGGLTGAGWKLSAQETLRETSLTDFNNTTTSYIIYNDSDGTEHYFRKDSDDKYLDEDGMNLQITKSGNEYTMKERPATSGSNTSSNAKKVFWRGYLTEIHDNNDNAIYFLYNNQSYDPNSDSWKPTSTSGQKLKKIIQLNNDGSQIVMATLTYNSENYLSKVVDYSNRETSFGYTTIYGGKYLTTIAWPDKWPNSDDHKTTSYYYDSTHYRMSELRDNESGYGLALDYYYFRNARVVHQVTEKTTIGSTTSTGNSWHAYHHSRQLMEYRFYGADHTAETLDDIVTRYSFDFEGRTINATNLDTVKVDVLGVSTNSYTKNANTSQQNNRMTGASASGKAAINLLKNSGAEKLNANQSSGAESWTATHPGSTSLGNTAIDGTYVRNNQTISPHTGEKLFKAFIATTDCSKFYQPVYLEGGKTYTLSAYINTAGNTSAHFGSGGAFVAFYKENAYGVPVINKKSTYVNYPTSNTIDGGWERVSVTYTPVEDGKYLAAMGVENCTSVVVSFDDLQLETGDASSNANLIQFGSFETVNETSGDATPVGATTYWTTGTGAAVSTPSHHGSYCMRINGSLTGERHAVQTVNVKADIDSTWLLSGWAKADSVANTQADPDDSNAENKRYFGLIAMITYSDESTEKHYVPFNDDYTGWQYASGIVVPKVTDTSKTVTSITVYTAYDYNGNTAWFDEISLRAEPVETYKYDSEGKLKAVNSTDNNSDSYTYNGPDLSQAKTGVTGTFNYTYEQNTHNMTKATTNSNNTLDVDYDSMGNAKTTKWYVTSQPNAWYLQTSTNYTSDGNHIQNQTDANGITTEFVYYGSGSSVGLPGQLKSSTTGSGATTVSKYTRSNGRPSQTYQNGIIAANYLYNSQGFINSIARKTFPRSSYNADPSSSSAQWQSYKFTTDSFGNPTNIYVSASDSSVSEPVNTDIRLAHYDYETYVSGVSGIKNGRLRKTTYGNGDYVTFAYDRFDQVVRQDYSDGKTDLFFYNTEGFLTKKARVRIYDLAVDEVSSFEYDSLGRMIRSRQSADGDMYDDGTISDGDMVQRTEHLYDAENRITQQSSVLGSRTYTSTYTYNDDVSTNTSGIKDGSLKQMTFSQPSKTLSYTYDSLKHLATASVNGIYTRTYTYRGINSQRSSNQISGLSYAANGNTNLSSLSYSYTYDNRGNVTKIQQNSSTVAEYTYNSQNQMITEKRNSVTYTYTYDTAGNILGVSSGGIYAPKSYTYNDTVWQDLLTAYNGHTIYYEGQNNDPTNYPVSGNPTNWYNGNTYTNLTWTKGRQLSSLSKGSTNITYTYNMDGIRKSKTVGNEQHTYLTESGKVMRETIGTGSTAKILDFVYDDKGLPFALLYYPNSNSTSPAIYYYITNMQGDVVRLVNSTGATAAAYTYDAWGNVSVTDYFTFQIGELNPLRYRGYYYDNETGWYYLQSRYYDPEVGRFINADLQEYAADYSIDDNNLFAYCGNNPVLREDNGGDLWGEILTGVAIVAGITAICALAVATAGVSVGVLAIAGGGTALSVSISSAGATALVVSGYSCAVAIPAAFYAQKVSRAESHFSYSESKINQSKGGKQNIRDSGLVGVSNEELKRRLKDPRTSKKEKQRMIREQKGRGSRNIKKRRRRY